MKTLYKILLIAVVITCNLQLQTSNCYAQAPDWVWAKIGGGGEAYGSSVVAAPGGNIYISGGFTAGTILFGHDTMNNSTFTGAFLAELDSNGNPIWAKSIGQQNEMWAGGITLDKKGNVYLTGYYQGAAPLIFGPDTLHNAGGNDIFIMKYSGDDKEIWARSAGGGDYDYGESIAVDKNGQVYITGEYHSNPMLFDTIALYNADITGGTTDIYIASYDSSGKLLWAKRAYGTAQDESRSIAVDENGDAYITGSFASPSITFGSNVFHQSTGGDGTMFIAKYDVAGNVVWAEEPSKGADGFGIATDKKGFVYVTGSLFGTPVTFGNLTVYPKGGNDIFASKFDSEGNVIWMKYANANSTDEGYSICADTFGNVYLTGFMESDSLLYGNTWIHNKGYDDVVIVKYDNDGNVIWAASAGGNWIDAGNGIATDNFGNVYAIGTSNSDTCTFGPFVTTPGLDMFIVKLRGGGISTSVPQINNDNNITIFPNPSDGQFQILDSRFQIERIEVYNLVGELILDTSIKTQDTRLDLSNQPAGIYFCKVMADDGTTQTGKIIIQ